MDELKQQWIRPTDVLSVLLLLGGEIVNRALAQLAGGAITPVAFSFGAILSHHFQGWYCEADKSTRLGLVRRNHALGKRW